ncbi:MAG: hypothetical protein LCI00_14055 [Chloroflexi bacterium]|nr:hypothetical protein [Chloroflexota bacterium]
MNRQVAKNAKIKAERFNTKAQWHKGTEGVRELNRQVAKNAKIKTERFNTKAQWHKGTEGIRELNRQVAKNAKIKTERFNTKAQWHKGTEPRQFNHSPKGGFAQTQSHREKAERVGLWRRRQWNAI